MTKNDDNNIRVEIGCSFNIDNETKLSVRKGYRNNLVMSIEFRTINVTVEVPKKDITKLISVLKLIDEHGNREF